MTQAPSGPRPLAEIVAEIAERVARLHPPSARAPERFWEQKSDLAHELRAVARAMGGPA